MATLASNEAWNKASHTDSGALVFQFIRGNVFTQVFGGMIIRQDWLDELGLYPFLQKYFVKDVLISAVKG